MNYNEFMYRPINLKKRIRHKTEDVAFKLETCLNATPSIYEKVQSSPSNSTERRYIAYIDAKRELDELVAQYDQVALEVRTFMYDNLEDADADMLEWKYIEEKSIQTIAKISGIAYQTAKNRISKADRILRMKYSKYVPK